MVSTMEVLLHILLTLLLEFQTACISLPPILTDELGIKSHG